MTLLSEYESKKSWQSTLPVCPIYKSNTTGYKDLDFAAVIRQEPKLTLDTNSRTGLKEISILPITATIPEKWQKLVVLPPWEPGQFPPDEIARILIHAAKEYLLANWDANAPHLVLVSGGQDSRILSYVLRDIREEHGADRLGNVHFRTCKELHDDGQVFLDLMRRQEWKETQFSIFNADQECNADYYDYGNFDFNPNAYAPIQMNCFFGDGWLEKEDAKKVTVVGGNYCGELLNYPLSRAGFFKDHWKGFIEYINSCITNQCRIFYHFGDVLLPFMGYEYLALGLRIPNEYYKYAVRGKQRTDYIRALMLQEFEDIAPFVVGHQFDFALKEKRREHMRKRWLDSKFYKDFRPDSRVATAEPWTAPRTAQDSKLYSLACVYERV